MSRPKAQVNRLKIRDLIWEQIKISPWAKGPRPLAQIFKSNPMNYFPSNPMILGPIDERLANDKFIKEPRVSNCKCKGQSSSPTKKDSSNLKHQSVFAIAGTPLPSKHRICICWRKQQWPLVRFIHQLILNTYSELWIF